MTLFLARFANTADVGIFRVGMQFALLLSFLLQAVETGMSPQIAALHSQGKLHDLLGAGGKSTMELPQAERRTRLERLLAHAKAPLHLTPVTRDREEAQRWLQEFEGAGLDGVIAKLDSLPYQPAKRAMLKIKHVRSADCVVAGFRWYKDREDAVGSLLLGLYDDQGRLDHVGFTSTITDAERPALTERLEKLKGGSGFTGSAPGGPSRWSGERSAQWTPLEPELVVEVRYDHVTGDRFRHGTKLLRWRPDKAPEQCTLKQLRAEAAPERVMAATR